MGVGIAVAAGSEVLDGDSCSVVCLLASSWMENPTEMPCDFRFLVVALLRAVRGLEACGEESSVVDGSLAAAAPGLDG